MVIDADALNTLGAMTSKWWKRMKSAAVLTPHPGEMSRFNAALNVAKKDVPIDDAGRLERAVLASRTFKQIILLKGHRTIITDGRRVYVNQTGNSALSKAGSGDVLSGIIGSLLGQAMNGFDAACAGAWIHGKAGELAGERTGSRSVLARDVIGQLGQALHIYPNSSDEA
jgi:NAD(P)H-hydrate epimerase